MLNYEIVTGLKEIKRKDWAEFVKKHPKGNIFQTPFIFDAYQKSKNFDPLIIIVLDSEKSIVGLQVSVIESNYNNFLGYFTSRSIIKGGPIVKNEDITILNLILKEYIKLVKGKAIYSQYRNMWDWGSLKKVFIKNNFLYEDHLDILFDLTKGEEILFKEMMRVRKKGIKKSYNMGVSIKEIDLNDSEILSETYVILKNVYKRIKLPIPDFDFFKNIKIHLREKVLSLGLYKDDELIAVRIAFCYKNLVYDWYAGAKDEFLNHRPNDVLPWELMKWGMNKKYEIFDFGGAGKPNIPYGVRDFKMKFGGKLVNYGRFEIIHKPFLLKIAEKGFLLLQKIKFV